MIQYESNYYGVSDLGSNELYHHGVKGMKWGVRRYQNDDGSLTVAGRARYGVQATGRSNKPVSRRKLQKTLRKADDAMGEIQYQVRRSDKRLAKVASKATKLQARTELRKNGPTERDARKLEKLTEQVKKEGETRKKLQKSNEEIRSGINKTIAKALSSGYSIKSETYTHDVREGRHYAAQYLGGIGGQLLSRALSDSRVTGVRYKVTKTKEGEKASWQHTNRTSTLVK